MDARLRPDRAKSTVAISTQERDAMPERIDDPILQYPGAFIELSLRHVVTLNAILRDNFNRHIGRAIESTVASLSHAIKMDECNIRFRAIQIAQFEGGP